MELTIYSLCWNEEIILPYFFDHYKKKFPNVKFIIYDNMSNDKSREIISNNGGEIIDFESNNESREDLQMNIRNHCWKNATTDWVMVCDIDEFFDVDSKYLSFTKSTILKGEGYEMVGDTYELNKLEFGTRNNFLDKCTVFNKKFISEINYSNGCHDCFPVGQIHYNKERIVLRHIKYFKLEYVINRFENLASRLSSENLENRWSLHYLQTKNEIINSFNFLFDNRRKVPLPWYYHNIEILFENYKKNVFIRFFKKIIYLPKGVRRK